MADRVQISRPTLRRLETGDPGVGIGIYETALYVLGMVEQLSELADIANDSVGRQIATEELPIRIHAR
jgi:hypothetical protein